MGFLRLLRRRGFASADGPHGFVSNHDSGPVLDLVSESRKLTRIYFVSSAAFSFVELFANAGHDGETVLEGELGLLGNNGIGFAQDVATLAVAEDDPADFGINEHLSRGFAGVCAVVPERGILGSDLDLGASKGMLDGGQVEGGRSHHNFDLLAVEAHTLQDRREGSGKIEGAIALPVAAD